MPKILSCPYCGKTNEKWTDDPLGRRRLRIHMSRWCEKNPKKKKQVVAQKKDKTPSINPDKFTEGYQKVFKKEEGGNNMQNSEKDLKSILSEFSQNVKKLENELNEYLIRPRIEEEKRKRELEERTKMEKLVEEKINSRLQEIDKKINALITSTKGKAEDKVEKKEEHTKKESAEHKPVIKMVHGGSVEEMLKCPECEPILTPQVAEMMLKYPEWREKVLSKICSDDKCRVDVMQAVSKFAKEKGIAQEEKKEEGEKKEEKEEKKSLI